MRVGIESPILPPEGRIEKARLSDQSYIDSVPRRAMKGRYELHDGFREFSREQR